MAPGDKGGGILPPGMQGQIKKGWLGVVNLHNKVLFLAGSLLSLGIGYQGKADSTQSERFFKM